jgi:hypothetical protein
VGRIVLRRENYQRAILEFCNNIGTDETQLAIAADVCSSR